MMHARLNPQAVFLDRDGTLIENRHYLAEPNDVSLLPGVSEALEVMLTRGTQLFLFTNQSGVGRGWFTLADVEAVNRRMIDLLGLGPNIFTRVCIATERPDEPPKYRKPAPRFIEESLAAHRISAAAAWMVGDSPSDWEAGLNAGIQPAGILIDGKPGANLDVWLSRGVQFFNGLLAWVDATFD